MKMSKIERNAKASAVMEFAEMIAGAYMSGFIDNHPTVYDIYRSAQNHVKDNYQVDTDVWDDEHAKESRSDTYDSLVEEVERFRSERDDLERFVKSLRSNISGSVSISSAGVDVIVKNCNALLTKIKGES